MVDSPPVMHECASYLHDIVARTPVDKTIQRCVKLLEPTQDKWDTIAVRGVSGLLIGPVLAHLMRKELIVIRKPEDDTASRSKIEGHVTACSYVIVDDLICSGSTCVQIMRAVRSFAVKANLYGILVYTNPEWFPLNHHQTTGLMRKAGDARFNPHR